MDKLPVEFKEKWVTALRSGEYKQGTGELYNPNSDSYCCMGVAGIVCGLTKDQIQHRAYLTAHTVKQATTPVPLSIVERSGFNLSETMIKLADMNDGNNFGTEAIPTKPFTEIADFIEQNL